MNAARALLLAILALPLGAQSWLNEGTSRTIYVKHKAAHATGGILIAGLGAEMDHPYWGIAGAWAAGVGNELYEKHRCNAKVRGGDIAWTGGPATVLSLSFKWGQHSPLKITVR